jgi:hypothetical protein
VQIKISAWPSLYLGMYLQIISGNILKEGIGFANKIATVSLKGRRTSQLPIKDAARAQVLHQSKQNRSPAS